jgi:thiamine transport system substrate-binding protein
VDHYLWSRAKPYLEDWHGWEPHGYHRIDPQYRVEAGFLPYDYGLMTFVVDRQAAKASGVGIPSSLRDLVGSEWMRNILLEDPRTSTPGLAFLLYSRVVFGSEVGAFWEKLQSRWLTLAPNWTSAYGLFLKGEAPIVWSYMTSQAYHESQGQASRYQALVLREGQPMQIEGAALVRGAFENDPEQDPPEVRRRLAHEFLEFLITPEAQALIPHTTWMMPVLSEVELPADFKHLPQVTRKILPEAGSQVIEVALDEWRKSVENSQ